MTEIVFRRLPTVAAVESLLELQSRDRLLDDELEELPHRIDDASVALFGITRRDTLYWALPDPVRARYGRIDWEANFDFLGHHSRDPNAHWRAFDLDLRCEQGDALHCLEVFGRQLVCALHGLHPDAVLAFAGQETAKAASDLAAGGDADIDQASGMLSQNDLDRIWFGCGNFGGIGSSPALRSAGDSEERALRLLDYAHKFGLHRFDTANTYGGGASEIILGKWLGSKGPGLRQSTQVATKVGNPNGCPPGQTPLSRTQIAHHLDESLRRLGVERIDLFYVHEFDGVTPLEETLGAMEQALEAGKIDRFGISNASLADAQAVRALAGASLGARFDHIQNEYNLLATADAEALIPWCVEQGLRYTAFSPLAGGFLTGKYRPGEPIPLGSRYAHAPEFGAVYASESAFAAIEQLRQSADALEVTLAEAALRFVLDTPGVDSLIVAPRRPEHFEGMGLSKS